ncbi:hypothetical protein, partial [Thiolapillus sp.]|uniref:hypothetical protein n=1 Tax=Thiolapillus sp. TaxID=2017437 RepID=UPI003AF626BA
SSQSTSQRLSKQPNFYNYDLHDCQPGGFHTEIHMKRRRASLKDTFADAKEFDYTAEVRKSIHLLESALKNAK